jgi:hypothetical protein
MVASRARNELEGLKKEFGDVKVLTIWRCKSFMEITY